MLNLLIDSPALSLPMVLRALRAAVGNWGGRGLLAMALAWLVYRRLGAITRQLERLAARFAQGLPVRRMARSGHAVTDGVGERAARTRVVRLWPGGFAWLVRVAAHEAAGFGLHMRAILAHPEMIELLIAAPQARRLLTPVCRMLGVEACLLRPAGAHVGVSRRHPKARAAPVMRAEPEQIKLPRGVLTAVRSSNFAKRR